MKMNTLTPLAITLVLLGCGDTQDPGVEPVAGELQAPAVEGLNDEDAAIAAPDAAPALPAQAGDGGGAPVVSSRFQLGTHYERLSPTQPTSSSPTQVEVTEIFWYGCPHCYTFDPYLQRWQSGKADYVNFVRVPAVWNPLVRLHARGFYTAEALGKGAEMHDAFFKEIHVNGNALDTAEKLEEFFGGFRVDAVAFKSAFDSFAVHAKLQRADELSRRYQIGSVPTIVVNGKYTTDGGMAGGYDALIDLIDELAAAEHGSN
jgi:thiol:disulfide interchange protein DsbA